MLDLLPHLDRWAAEWADDDPKDGAPAPSAPDAAPTDQTLERLTGDIAIATVVKVWGSAPRPLGSKMAISSRGEMAGSVSGGCVEGAVFEEAQSVLWEGSPKLVSFGVDQETAWSVGLSCGGQIDIFIERGFLPELIGAVRNRRLVARALVLGGTEKGRSRLIYPDGDTTGDLGSPALNRQADAMATDQWATLGARKQSIPSAASDESDEDELFLEVHAPPPRLIIVGAVHVAVALVSMAKLVGFETIVIDPRTAFATRERFGHADQLLHDWPDEGLRRIGVDANTYVALLSHDLKLDVPALQASLHAARYVGALGSRKTQGKRLAAARQAGIDERLLERIHNPIGLDLGGRRAEEIAVAVLAEMVSVSHGKTFKPIPDTTA